ncbi:MAG: TonB-dependent receptor [Dysgonamonadaceae bacterium]|jgi:TonB-linked SusC/RagA family outer membrane protein|nr:TonB-dependent receptor [Dysgonamonadaceae bacterium]
MNKSYLFYLILFGASLLSNELHAQRTIRGVVTDTQNEPLIGVSVKETVSGEGTVTDMEGQFQLSVASGARLQFSYIGYKTVEIPVDSRPVYNVRMAEDISELDEVVVVAYGTQRKKEITGAIAVVDTKQMEKMTLPGIGQALQGLATGVHVTTSGVPGSGADIVIRGIGSFNSVSPLYVIDGMILENSQREFNMHDVESVQVLKDASATALYGARGANGVILISTKKGGDGATKISFNSTIGVSQIAKRYEMMNSVEFLRINRMAYENANKMWPGEPAQGQKLINTDWQDEFYKTGITKDNNLSVAGGNKNGNYMFSFDMYNEDGTVVGPFHNRMTVRSNAEAKKGIFTIGENLMIGHSETKTLFKTKEGNPFIDLARMPPVIPVYANEEHTEYGYGNSSYQTYGTNPVGAQETNDSRQYNLRIIGSAFAQIEPVKGLQIKTNLGIEYFNWFDKYKTVHKQLRYLTTSEYDDELYEANGAMQSWLWENTAFYKNSIGKHNFDVLLGYTAQKQDRRGNNITGYNMIVDDIWVIKNVSKEEGFAPSVGSPDETHIAMTSILGRINYNYADRYLLQFNVRRDGSSLFGEKYHYGVFPGVSLGWRISGEEFMQPVDWINDLKLRLSYGKSGNQKAIDPYKFAAYIAGGDRVAIFGSDPKIYQGLIQTGLANSALRWETRETYNVGLDFTMLDQHLYGSVDCFDARLYDLLIQRSQSWMKGVDVNPWENYGKIKNTGFELQLGWREIQKAFKYDIALNLTHTSNKVLNLGGDEFYYAGLGQSSYSAIGRSLGDFYVLRTDGIFQDWDEIYQYTATITDPVTGQQVTKMIQPNAQPGDIRYKDINHDGEISVETDRDFVGSPFPTFEAGLNFSCEYKGFDLNLFFYGVYGNYIYNNTKFWLERMDETANLPKNLNPWNGKGTSNTTPRPYMNTSDNVLSTSDRWIERGDYLRLKNIQMGYTLPQKVLQATKFVERLRVYVGAQNLFTLTDYSGLDPEISGGGIYDKGYDDGHFPPVRTITCGLQISF